ncbi:hypothetical protein [Actinomadura logoneensis]|uniref:hypothetical protein n=1 Tax=Actinomadura logoneensis TaxID=2293572 RepID=UPI001F3C7BE9|nr:hypothetical protein [Actinomadura logoneensis]
MSRATLTLAVIVSCELMLMLDGTITNGAITNVALFPRSGTASTCPPAASPG